MVKDAAFVALELFRHVPLLHLVAGVDDNLLGLYLANVIGTNVLPNEPVPPVIRIVLLVNMLSSKVIS